MHASDAAPRIAFVPAEKHWHRIAWIVAGMTIAIGAGSGIQRGLAGRPNWGSIQRESRYVWEHRQSAPATALFGYLPTAVFALWPFTTWLPGTAGEVAFVCSNLLAALITTWLLARYWLPDARPASSIVWPLLLVVVNIAHVLQANQLTLWTLLLCVAGLTMVGRSRPLAGGFVLGLAGLVKSMPLLFIAYLVLRREWRGVVGFFLAIVVADIVPCLVFFGPRGTIEEHRAWLRRAEWHSNSRLIDDPLLRVHRHGSNASFSAVLARWLRRPAGAQRQIILEGSPPAEVVTARRAALGQGEWLSIDPMTAVDRPWSERVIELRNFGLPQVYAVDLSPQVIKMIWALIVAIALAGLALFTLRTPRRAWAPLASLWMLAMLLPSPMLRHYYLALAFPALVVIWRTYVGATSVGNPRWTAIRALGPLAGVGWLVGVAGLGWNVGRWYGLHLVVLLIVAVATIACVRLNSEQSARGESSAGAG